MLNGNSNIRNDMLLYVQIQYVMSVSNHHLVLFFFLLAQPAAGGKSTIRSIFDLLCAVHYHAVT